jgi:hypothetical protein
MRKKGLVTLIGDNKVKMMKGTEEPELYNISIRFTQWSLCIKQCSNMNFLLSDAGCSNTDLLLALRNKYIQPDEETLL